MRLYDDPVEVRRGETEGPDQFLWHGRLWKVRSVLAHWVETAPWWQSTGARAVIGSDDAGDTLTTGSGGTDLLVERELWRVEAGRGSGGDGLRAVRGLRPVLLVDRRQLAARRLCGLRRTR